MKKFIILNVSIFWLGAIAAIAQHNTKIHVAINGKDSGSIGNQNAPFRKIQSAIGYALNGDTIIVGSGIYYENIQPA